MHRQQNIFLSIFLTTRFRQLLLKLLLKTQIPRQLLYGSSICAIRPLIYANLCDKNILYFELLRLSLLVFLTCQNTLTQFTNASKIQKEISLP